MTHKPSSPGNSAGHELVKVYEQLRKLLDELEQGVDRLDAVLAALESLLPEGYVHGDDRRLSDGEDSGPPPVAE